MTSDQVRGAVHLSLVKTGGANAADRRNPAATEQVTRDVDWSILMARAQTGDGAAYRRLLIEVTPYLRSLAARRHSDLSDREDAVQDILLTVHAIRATYDPARPFGPWLVAIANRRLIDRLRQQGRRASHEGAPAGDIEDIADPLAGTDVHDDHETLERAIFQLSPAQQQAIRLLKLKEMPLAQVASETGHSVSALKVTTHRAIASLRKLMADWSNP